MTKTNAISQLAKSQPKTKRLTRKLAAMTEKANNDQFPEVGEDIFVAQDNLEDPAEQDENEEE